MTLAELIRICKAYSDLGWSMQGQIENVLENTMGEANEIALSYIKGWLLDVSDIPDLADEANDMIERIYGYEESLS